jgi:hypothetical protein
MMNCTVYEIFFNASVDPVRIAVSNFAMHDVSEVEHFVKKEISYNIVKYFAAHIDNDLKDFDVKIPHKSQSLFGPFEVEPYKPFTNFDPQGSADGSTVKNALTNAIPNMRKVKKDCPVEEDCAHKNRSLMNLIQHLNDTHKWTREAIADWLESLDEDLSFGEKS